jgi:opacity protein-like surface antigen
MRIRYLRMAAALATAAAALAMAPTATAAEPAAAPAAVAPAGLPDAGLAKAGTSPIVFSKTDGFGITDVITCTGSSEYPHNSTATPSAVTGKSRSYCTAPITEIRVQAELWRYLEGYGYAQTGTGELGVAFKSAGTLTSTAYDICQGRLAYWVTVGRHTFFAPPGYSPPKISFATGTPGIGVNC